MITSEKIVSGPSPVLLKVTVTGSLTLPNPTSPKSSAVADKLASGLLPLPVKLTSCEPLTASSLNSSVPVLAPALSGVNVTETVQLSPGSSVAPQVVVSVKSEPFSPPNAIPVISSNAVPLFVRVTVNGWLDVPTFTLPKSTLAGDSVTSGTATPTPVRVTVCGLPASTSVKTSVPLRMPATVGVNVTVTAQLSPGSRLTPHVVVWVKSPVTAIPLIASGVAPAL